MENRLTVLKLVLDEIGVPVLETNEDEVQENIYNMQKNGFELCYHFGIYGDRWLSPSLTRDYSLLVESLMIGDYNQHELKEIVIEAIKATQNKEKISNKVMTENPCLDIPIREIEKIELTKEEFLRIIDTNLEDIAPYCGKEVYYREDKEVVAYLQISGIGDCAVYSRIKPRPSWDFIYKKI